MVNLSFHRKHCISEWKKTPGLHICSWALIYGGPGSFWAPKSCLIQLSPTPAMCAAAVLERIHSPSLSENDNLLLLMNGSFVMVVHNGDEQQEFIVCPPLSLQSPGRDIAIWPNYLSLAASVITGPFYSSVSHRRGFQLGLPCSSACLAFTAKPGCHLCSQA